MYHCCRNGDAGVAAQLIALGADVDAAENKYGFRPVHAVAEQGHIEVAKLLLSAGVDADALTNCGNTALAIATMNNHHDMADVLQAGGAQLSLIGGPDGIPMGGMTSILQAVAYGCAPFRGNTGNTGSSTGKRK